MKRFLIVAAAALVLLPGHSFPRGFRAGGGGDAGGRVAPAPAGHTPSFSTAGHASPAPRPTARPGASAGLVPHNRPAGNPAPGPVAAGPGWDWETLQSFYPDPKIYTEQLLALETYQRSHPKEADASFLLAYHYLTLDYTDAAAKQLELAAKLAPGDTLSAQLLKPLQQPSSDRPAPQP